MLDKYINQITSFQIYSFETASIDNKNVCCMHHTFLEIPSSGTLIIKRMESQIIYKSLGARIKEPPIA